MWLDKFSVDDIYNLEIEHSYLLGSRGKYFPVVDANAASMPRHESPSAAGDEVGDEHQEEPGRAQRNAFTEIRCHVINLPRVVDATDDLHVLNMLHDAWERWTSIVRFHFRSSESIGDANVIISCEDLSPSHRSFDVSTIVGPPNDLRVSLKFDSHTRWTIEKFLATAAHEVGHGLGLDEVR